MASIFLVLLVLAMLINVYAIKNSSMDFSRSDNDNLSFTFSSEFDEVESSRSNPSNIYQQSMGLEELIRMNEKITNINGDFTDFVPEDFISFMSYLTTRRIFGNKHFLHLLRDKLQDTIAKEEISTNSETTQCQNDMDALFKAFTSPIGWGIYTMLICPELHPKPKTLCGIGGRDMIRNDIFPKTTLTDWALSSK